MLTAVSIVVTLASMLVALKAVRVNIDVKVIIDISKRAKK